ncbi:hypothetical protein GCM10010174_84200 [Kutzneria viridogrisea]|uniref:Peptidase A2 domain-containing protein n=2 Tax=Kutzneria TaxID=43356 RepID=W5WI97_9PSEU|nr:hypothetical protein [Kutzneria albida]AHI00312.1 hypothetical protein KALB_6953 [Kutzneria albida DSM 43870]MBA8925490.1 hypothetical protein [Kutzneria viridogrisea]
MTDGPLIGAGGLLRVAGLPARLWTEAGNPELFTRLRERVVEQQCYAEFAGTLADRLGAELVPHPYLEPEERAGLLALRRLLHRGSPVPEADCYALAGAVSGLSPELAEDLAHAGDWSAALAVREQAAEQAVLAEQRRLAGLPWRLVTASPFATRAVTEAAPGMMDDIQRRLDFGENWDSKRLRHRADYLLRVLARGAAKPTPRDWLGHVGLLPVGERRGNWTQVGASAAHWVANIQAERRQLAANLDLRGATMTITGLHWLRDHEHMSCWVVDPADRTALRRVLVRRTPALDAVRRALESGVRDADELVRLLSPTADEERREVLRGFLRHLVELGVVQLSAEPASELIGWDGEVTSHAEPGFVDVYRQVGGTMPADAVGRLQELVGQASRVGELLASASPPPREHPILALVGPAPRPVTEVLAEYLRAHRDCADPELRLWDNGIAHDRPSWPEPPADPASPYGRLLALLDTDAEQVVLTPRQLDELGAPPAQPSSWPMDCLVRPIGGGGSSGAVLEAVTYAGVVDARFAEALHQLHGEVPQVTAYRRFLDELARRCGAEFVEILVPPLHDKAANAVRRPHYCPTWTGDADAASYQPGGGRYLPLERITVRRVGSRIVAEDVDGPDGMALWPIHHATRTPLAPWGLVITLLSAASPARQLARPLALGSPATALRHRDRLPRLVLAGGLVLCGAQWRIGREQLPATDLPVPQRIRELAALRIGTGVPRWVFARTEGGHQPRPVDLDSVGALRVLDKLLADAPHGTLLFEEMLPDPEHLPFRDADRAPIAGQLLARLPHESTPNRLAARATLAWARLINAEQDRALPSQRAQSTTGIPVGN